jgi:hypothetical protein
MFSSRSFDPNSFGLPPLQDLFLPDTHHPNAIGHRLMSDALIAYLESELCLIKKTLNDSWEQDVALDKQVALSRLKTIEESRSKVPEKGLFSPFDLDKYLENLDSVDSIGMNGETADETCLQVGNKNAKIKPVNNQG